MKKVYSFTVGLLAVILFMAGCGRQERTPGTAGKENGKTVLVIAAFEEDRSLIRQIERFNESHEDYELILQMYERSGNAEEDGVAKLQREIMAGGGPDIIDFGPEYAFSDIAGKYTEDLRPFLESEEGGGTEDFFSNIIDAFCYQGGLYALPVSFTLQTFAGSKQQLEGRGGWNIREMMEVYQKKSREKGLMLYPGETKRDVLGTILTGSTEYYIDWEKGTCKFDGEEFKQVLEFANLFPDSLAMDNDFSVKQAFLDGDALLLPVQLSGIYDICRPESVFGEEDVTYIGFPVEGESGTVIRPSYPVLAISIGSKHKDTAWEFIRRFLEEEYQSDLRYGFPLKRSVLEEALLENREPEYRMDAEGNQSMAVKSEVCFEGEAPEEIYCITEKQAEKLIDLIETATFASSPDGHLYNVFLDEAAGYFAGDKTVEDAAAVIQSRASLYVGERVK